jgi:2-keto-4-pentenoate hydratase
LAIDDKVAGDGAMNDGFTGEHAESRKIAQRLVRARLDATAMLDYPGALPQSLDAGYASQDAAISLWPTQVAGWKVGKIPDAWEARLGEERLVGPIFADAVQTPAPGATSVFAAIDGGFAAVEAEFVFRMGADAPVGKIAWTDEEALGWVDTLFVGLELAGSPLPDINELGPCVVVSDFGNNTGLILGPEVVGWRGMADSELPCETWIDGVRVGSGRTSDIAGGIVAALRFALARCARRGMPLRKGQFVSTGAVTGIHEIRAGQTARVVFPGHGEIDVRVEQASPRAAV